MFGKERNKEGKRKGKTLLSKKDSRALLIGKFSNKDEEKIFMILAQREYNSITMIAEPNENVFKKLGSYKLIFGSYGFYSHFKNRIEALPAEIKNSIIIIAAVEKLHLVTECCAAYVVTYEDRENKYFTVITKEAHIAEKKALELRSGQKK